MRPIRCLAIYIVVVFAGGALLAPWLYQATQWGAGHWAALAGLAANPFHRFVLRAVLGLAVIGLWPLLKSCGMSNLRELGLVNAGRPAAKLAAGFGIGFASLACAAGLAICFGGREASLSHTAAETGRFLVGTTLASVIVAVLEELIFRASLFGILRKTFAWPLALVVSSAVYSAVHFLRAAPQPVTIDWLSGFTTLAAMFHVQPGGLPIVPECFTLFAAGAILATAYQRSGTLFMSIGLHAGWIFWLKSYHFLTHEATGSTRAIWGSDRLIDGWLPFLVLVCVLILMLPKRQKPSPSA